MINRVILCVFGVLVVFGVLGCSSEVYVKPGVPVCLSSTSRDQIMDLCEDVLVRMQFEIEKFDTDKGYINTRPLRGSQFFEVWRSDNVGADNRATSNLHSILRTVELQITEDNGSFCVECKSQTRRLSIEESELSNSSANFGIFTGGSRTFQKLRPVQENLDWIDLGPDPELQQRILGRILARDEK